MKKLLFATVLICFFLHSKAQLPNCSGADSNCVFIQETFDIYKYNPALPISSTNPSLFLSSPQLPMAGLAISMNINGGAASPTFYTTSNGFYYWWDGTAWVATNHTAATVNIGGAATAIYGKNGGTGYISKYTGTGNDVFLVNGLPNSGPYDLCADMQDNFYEVDISNTIGYIYKRNPSGVIIDTIVVLNCPPQGAGPGFALIGNKVYFGLNSSPGVWGGTIINDTVSVVAIGTFANSGGDYASCPSMAVSVGSASLVYPTCSGPVTIPILSPMLTLTATVNWNFGDPASGINNTSNLANATHTFSGNGTYTVTTYISSNLGLDTVVTTVVVNNIVNGSSNITICAPNTYQGHSTSGVYIDTFAISPICDSIHTLNLTVNPQPVVNLGPDITLCQSLTAVLDAGPGFVTYAWDNAANTQTRTIGTPGIYYCTVTNGNGCTGSDTLQVFQDTLLQANFTMIKRLGCDQDSVEFVNTSTGASQYMWFFGDSQSDTATNPIHIYQNQMVYTVTLVAANPPCYDTVSFSVDVRHPMTAQIFAMGNGGPNGATLFKDSTCLLYDLDVQSTSFPIGMFTHRWYWGDGTDTNTLTVPFAKHFYPAPGNYPLTLEITDTLGCKADTTINIYVDDVAHLNFTISDSVVCVGEPISFNDNVSPYALSFEYDFADGSNLLNHHDPTHTYDYEGNYIVSLNAKNLLCPDSTRFANIVVDDYPQVDLGKDTSICPGITGTIILSNLLNPAGVYEWSTGEVANNLTVVNPGHYWVKAISPNAGCVSVDSIWIMRDCYINIPNAFSPDGDGLNDYFFPRELLSSGVKSFRMNIFNRWGQNIFTTEQIDGRGWDGRFNDKLQPMGVYIYVIDVEFINKIKKSFKGNVTLVR